MSFIDIKSFFHHKHDVECNQKYADIHPYSFHLDMVFNQALLFTDIICNEYNRLYTNQFYSKQIPIEVATAIYAHDSISDARMTYKNVVDIAGINVANIVVLCTEIMTGKTRNERFPESWYIELTKNSLAVFVKLMDNIANIKYSLLTNSSMYGKYKNEYNEKTTKYIKPLFPQYKEIFDYIEKLINI